MFYCYNTKNTTLWEKFQNPIEYSVHITHTQIYDLSLSMARYRHFNGLAGFVLLGPYVSV